MSTKNIPILFVTADLAVYSAEIGAEGKSGGGGIPVATQWMVDPASVRPVTDEESAEHAGLIAELIADVEPRRVWDSAGYWYIRGDVLLHARIGYTVTGRVAWGRSNHEFWLVLREKNAA